MDWAVHQHRQDSDYGVPILSHNRGALRGSLRTQDDGRAPKKPVETLTEGLLPQV